MVPETTTPTDAATDERNAPGDWKAGVVAGLAGGLVMGALMSLMNATVVAVAIPALYGLAPPPNPPTAPLTRST